MTELLFFVYTLSRLSWELTREAGDEGWEREGKNSLEQRHEICGRERDGAGYTDGHDRDFQKGKQGI